jgi:uncharacterized protein YukE
MGFWDGVEDTFKSVAEANVIPIGIAANIARFDDDPVGSITGILGVPIPALALAATVPLPGKDNTEPNISGAGGLPIIAAALSTLKQMRDQCGTGQPDQGGDFGTGNGEFQQIDDMMGSARTPDTWQGVASEAYGTANDHQRQRANKMADIDAKVAQTLATEAGQVAITRQALDGMIEYLNSCIPIATLLAAVPEAGDGLSIVFQTEVSSVALAHAYPALQGLTDAVLTNTAEVKLAAGLYGAIGTENGALPSSAGERLKVVTADLRQVSGIQDQIAAKIASNSQTTAGTAANVAKTHGRACDSTSAALSAAVAARADTATIMRTRSQRLSDGLQTAANRYDTADRQGGGKIDGSMHPR